MKKLYISFTLASLLLVSSAYAYDVSSRPTRMDPEQRSSLRSDMHKYNQDKEDGHGLPNIRQEHLEKLKAIDLDRHQRHIQLIQRSMDCIQRSTTPEQYKNCKQEERQAREQEKQKMKEMMQNLKQEHQSTKR